MRNSFIGHFDQALGAETNSGPNIPLEIARSGSSLSITTVYDPSDCIMSCGKDCFHSNSVIQANSLTSNVDIPSSVSNTAIMRSMSRDVSLVGPSSSTVIIANSRDPGRGISTSAPHYSVMSSQQSTSSVTSAIRSSVIVAKNLSRK